MTLWRALIAEASKLPGSLALLALLGAPVLLGLLSFLATLGNGAQMSWGSLIGSLVLALWAVFLLPIAIAAFATALGQVEHASRSWTVLLALPTPPSTIYLAKLILVLAATVLMSALGVTFSLLGGAAGGLIGGMPEGPVPLRGIAEMTATIITSAALLAVLQCWAALRLQNFVAAVGVGVGGVVVAMTVLLSGTAKLDWVPWVYPLVAVVRPEDAPPLIVASLVGAPPAALAMITDLIRRPPLS